DHRSSRNNNTDNHSCSKDNICATRNNNHSAFGNYSTQRNDYFPRNNNIAYYNFSNHHHHCSRSNKHSAINGDHHITRNNNTDNQASCKRNNSGSRSDNYSGSTTPPKETTGPAETTILTTTVAPKTTSVPPEITTTQPLETTPPKETTISPETTTLPITTLPITTTIVLEVTSTQPSTETTVPAETTLTTTVAPKTTSVPPEITTTQPLETTPPKETTISPETTTLPITTPPITTTIAPEVTSTPPSTETTTSPEITTLTTKPVVKTTTVVPEVTTSQVPTSPPKETTGPAETTLTTTVAPKTTSVPPEISTTQPLETSPPKETTISPETTTLPITTLPITTTIAPEVTSTPLSTETTISLTSIVTTPTLSTTFGILTGPKPTTLLPTTEKQVNVSTTVTSPVTTAPVCCFVNGTDFPPETIIYNVTDGFGWCFTAYCNATCDVVTKSYSCLTTPPPITTTPISTTAFMTTSTVGPTSIPTLAPPPTTVAPDCASLNPPRKPNETWQIGCQLCKCDGESMTVQCNPVVCPTTIVPTCDRPGDVLVNKTDGCCTSYECQCDTTQCVMTTMACPLGFTQERNSVQTGECCPTYTCKPMKVCVQNGILYQPGSPMPSDDVCEECECSSDVNPSTELLNRMCKAKQCITTCDEGYEYQVVHGKCCGECVRTSCVVIINNATVNIPMNETFRPPDDKCVTYTCQDINGDPMAKESRKLCPVFNPDTCVPGTETTDADGCCLSCTPKGTCSIQSNTTVLVHGDCKSVTPVEITSCSGACATSSMYSAESNTVEHMCSCCYEQETTKKQVEMICTDGTTTTYTYIYINSCGCQVSECTKKQRRRRSLNSELSMRRPDISGGFSRALWYVEHETCLRSKDETCIRFCIRKANDGKGFENGLEEY
ncbi:hypothetical protein QTP70_033002, partial [Hemibagrus guttatus]